MINQLFSSTRSLTGRLAAFFLLLSVSVGLFCYAIFIVALVWSEDRVGERRILLDRDIAVERFIAGEKGPIDVDLLTVAYNDLSDVPGVFDKYLVGNKHFLGETDEEPISHMLYLGEYTHNGKTYPIVLSTEIDRIEFTSEEMMLPIVAVLAMVSVLMFSFGTLLYKLSQKLIEPINSLTSQLEEHRGEIGKAFEVPENAAIEFVTLTKELNHYRSEIKSVIQREQAFARYASHELRTPLTVMQGSTNLLARGEKSEFQARQVGRIAEATYQMRTMVDALLSLVRYERSKDDTPDRKVSREELEKIVAQNSAQASDKQLAFDIHVTGFPSIPASEAVMNMLVGNLIRNAIAATPQGMIRIEMTDKNLLVIDEGEGLQAIPSEDGHGMGLLIVEHLCQRFSWRFSLQNHSDGGCVAAIFF
ncbi:sensor histidine kinase [Vibrio sp. HN007]|uniref:sensor histidine kinase n=1 Tax=Vibrio iocasae TaxID=3098914 RepID=UPI0035D517AF